MKDLSNLLGKTYQGKNQLYKQQLKLIGMDEMAVYVRFNNGHALLLSTFQQLLTSDKPSNWCEVIPHKNDGYAIHQSVWLGDDGKVFHADFDQVIQKQKPLCRVYSIIRRCTECEFIFSGFLNSFVTDPYAAYERTIRNFELLSVRYIETFKKLIMDIEIDYRHAIVFNNLPYLKMVIKGSDGGREILTLKERECLSMAMTGASFKHIAKQLNVSERTVKFHCRNLREKLFSSSLLEAAIVALYLGEIGCIFID